MIIYKKQIDGKNVKEQIVEQLETGGEVYIDLEPSFRKNKLTIWGYGKKRQYAGCIQSDESVALKEFDNAKEFVDVLFKLFEIKED